MKISFLLTRNTLSGGHRVVYELSNRLTERGHSVSIYYPVVPPSVHLRVRSLAELKGLLRSIQAQLTAGRPSWFDVRMPLIKMPWISPRWFDDADVLVASQWDLLWTVRDFPARKGVKVHYIFDSHCIFGQWGEMARKAWELPFFRIVTTRRLLEKIHKMGLEAEHVPIAVDLESFRLRAPLEQRNPYAVAMLYSNSRWKAFEDGLKVLSMARRTSPEIRVTLFGPAKLKRSLEPWMLWKGLVPNEKLVEIYNQAGIFLCSSLYEGWGLPGMEAMACGCALVSTKHDGVQEYAEHEVSALLAPIGDVETLAQYVCRLISDDALRIQIARKGIEAVQQFPWERSVELFEQALLEALQKG